MRIYVIGTGGVGGFYGGLLARHDCDVTFVARGDHYRAIVKDGLKVESVVGDFTIQPAKVISSIAEIEAPDLVLITVKTYDTEEISKQLNKVVNKDTVIISLQNGVDNDEQISKYIKNAIIVPGCVYIISEKTTPGLIVQTAGLGKLVFGSKDKNIEARLQAIEKLMQAAHIDATYAKDIDKGLWTKFLFIVPFAGITSLCRSSIGAIANDPGTAALYERCLSETLEVAQKCGIDVGEHEYNKVMQRLEDDKKKNSASKASMLIDIENSRRTEVESLHGKVCQLAAQFNMDVPVNNVIYNSIRLYSRLHNKQLVAANEHQ